MGGCQGHEFRVKSIQRGQRLGFISEKGFPVVNNSLFYHWLVHIFGWGRGKRVFWVGESIQGTPGDNLVKPRILCWKRRKDILSILSMKVKDGVWEPSYHSEDRHLTQMDKSCARQRSREKVNHTSWCSCMEVEKTPECFLMVLLDSSNLRFSGNEWSNSR